jgi:hypothetical protein
MYNRLLVGWVGACTAQPPIDDIAKVARWLEQTAGGSWFNLLHKLIVAL